MTVETYLQSEEAVRDVAALLARGPHERGEVPTESPYAWWGFDNFAPWTLARVGFRENPESSAFGVYFRAEDDRFIVSDLGEAVRALRLRTGRMNLPRGATWEAAAACGAMLDDGVLTMPGHVTAADLPRAIVRVMLAAVRVAALEV